MKSAISQQIASKKSVWHGKFDIKARRRPWTWSRGSKTVKNRRLRGSLGATLNREIGFVSSSCVACVRAGEAKLRVRVRCRGFLLGRPRLWQVVRLRSRPLCEAQDVVYVLVLRPNGAKSDARECSLQVFYLGFMNVLGKTSTHVWCIACRKNLIGTHV